LEHCDEGIPGRAILREALEQPKHFGFVDISVIEGHRHVVRASSVRFANVIVGVPRSERAI
jgi:hypothetical protein